MTPPSQPAAKQRRCPRSSGAAKDRFPSSKPTTARARSQKQLGRARRFQNACRRRLPRATPLNDPAQRAESPRGGRPALFLHRGLAAIAPDAPSRAFFACKRIDARGTIFSILPGSKRSPKAHQAGSKGGTERFSPILPLPHFWRLKTWATFVGFFAILLKAAPDGVGGGALRRLSQTKKDRKAAAFRSFFQARHAPARPALQRRFLDALRS